MSDYGYMRVSTRKQGSRFGLERQKLALTDAGIQADKLISDEISGTKKSRPGLDHLKEITESGDTISCVSLDRLGRSTTDTISLIEYFRAKGVVVRFLKENLTTAENDPYSNFFITMLSAFAQLEREMTLERSEMAREAMREKGIPIQGRPKADPAKVQASIELYQAGGKSLREVSAITGISASVICRAIKEQRELEIA